MGGIKKKRPNLRVNHVGIELEFLPKGGRGGEVRDFGLVQAFANSPLNRCIELHHEYHGHAQYGYEASLCCPETDYKTALREMIALIVANGGYITSHLGLHVHLDTRNRDSYKMQAAMTACQAELDGYMTSARIGESGRYPNYVVGREGYETVEVRMLQATFDIALITRYVDRLIEIVNTTVAAQVQELACV